MADLQYLLRESKTRFLQSFANNRINIQLEKPIISFTFDDVPRTALVNGIPILDQYNIKATYYVAMGLSCFQSSNNELEAYLDPDDILELHRNGHDIACHTYSHYMLKTGTAKDLAHDADKNVRKLKALLGTTSIEHFSYPFGQVNFKEKKLLANSYKTMRSSRPGINTSKTDMHLLRATSIYNPTFEKNKLIKIIEDAERQRGWLIFYTHGVNNKPDAYSCKTEQLQWVIQQCLASSFRILPISEAYSCIIKSQ